MIRRGDTYECEIESAAFEGKSVTRIDGFVVFVEGAVPGDIVRIRVIKKKKNLAEAVVEELITPSTMRTDPTCEHFGVCGGCKWQHVAYEEQLKFKSQHVLDCFHRLGGLSDFEALPILGCESSFYYRNKMEFSFSEKQWTVEKPLEGAPQQGVFVGLHVPRRYDKVIDIQACHLQSELSNEILTCSREFARQSGLPVYSSHADEGFWRFVVIRQSKRTAECMVNVVTYEDNPEVMTAYAAQLIQSAPGVTTIVNTINRTKSQVARGDEKKIYHGDGTIRETLGTLSFVISPESFFQTHTEQAERLYDVAVEFAGFTGGETVYDLYSGTGTIALYIAETVKEVLGIESVAQSVRDAEKNAEANGITNCDFLVGDLKDALSGHLHETRHPDVIVVDPPRSGMHAHAIEDVARIAPDRIVYISCNPATQARDCKAFLPLGYRTTRIRPVDMFPHTYHIENVALLERVPT
jgi:23S rRNA (uracil1939-C5)-methyltransferase